MHKTFKMPRIKHRLKAPPVLLFAQFFTDRQQFMAPLHAHDFWQLELIQKGSVQVKSGASSLEIPEGGCALIPQGIPHRFIYKEFEKREVWSIKFRVDMENPPISLSLLEKDDYSEHVLNEILNVLLAGRFEDGDYLHLAWLLGLFLEMSFKINPDSHRKADLVEKIKMRIDECEGRRVSVEDLAEFLQVSRNTVSKLFHDETGIQLKSYIDMRRMEVAKEILTYSKMSVSEIAAVMDFPDIYAFSKFFSRVSGLSPKAFRDSLKGKGNYQKGL
jgi:AraC-like DNA-binding protein